MALRCCARVARHAPPLGPAWRCRPASPILWNQLSVHDRIRVSSRAAAAESSAQGGGGPPSPSPAPLPLLASSPTDPRLKPRSLSARDFRHPLDDAAMRTLQARKRDIRYFPGERAVNPSSSVSGRTSSPLASVLGSLGLSMAGGERGYRPISQSGGHRCRQFAEALAAALALQLTLRQRFQLRFAPAGRLTHSNLLGLQWIIAAVSPRVNKTRYSLESSLGHSCPSSPFSPLS